MAKKSLFAEMYDDAAERADQLSDAEEPAKEPPAPPPEPGVPLERPAAAATATSSHRDPAALSTQLAGGKVKTTLGFTVELDEALEEVFRRRKMQTRAEGRRLQGLTKASIVEEILRRDAEIAGAIRDLQEE